MSGQAGARGYLVQSLICVLNSIDDHQWYSLSIEPNLASDKVDVIWYYPERTKVVQIKHSQNQITWAMVKAWADELEKSIQVEEYELKLIGPCNKDVASRESYGKVSIPKPHELNFTALIEQAAHKLDKYLESKNILKFTPKQRELIIEALTTKLSVYSTTGSKVSREDLDKLLIDWANETDRRAITPATSHQALELQVKDTVEDTLTWLRQNMTASYRLLCRSSVYRRPVPESFWLEMLMGFALNEKAYALETLKRRGFVEEEITRTGQSLLRLPERIKTAAYEFLGKIDKKVAHNIAVERWRTAYEPEPDDPNLVKVRGYLEAFHHLCELEDWKSAKDILTVRLKPTDDELHIQLGIWGYYQERIYLYSRLLGKLNSSFDSAFLKGLGNTYQSLGNYHQARNYHEQDLRLTKLIGDRAGEAKAWGNLGIAYKSLTDFARALECHEQNLAIAQEIGDQAGEGAALSNLGNVYYQQGNWSKALEYYERDLSITRKMGDRAREGSALGRIGSVYYDREDLVKALEYYQQELSIMQDMGDRAGEGAALGHMGNVYHRRGDLAEALKYHQQRLTIAQVIGDLAGEETALCNLGNVYSSKGDLEAALECDQQALTIARKIGDRVGEGRTLYNLGFTLITLGQYSQALVSLQTALEIVREVGAHYLEVKTLASLAGLHQKLNQCDLAVDLCDQALAIATKSRMQIADECQQLKEKLLSKKV